MRNFQTRKEKQLDRIFVWFMTKAARRVWRLTRRFLSTRCNFFLFNFLDFILRNLITIIQNHLVLLFIMTCCMSRYSAFVAAKNIKFNLAPFNRVIVGQLHGGAFLWWGSVLLLNKRQRAIVTIVSTTNASWASNENRKVVTYIDHLLAEVTIKSMEENAFVKHWFLRTPTYQQHFYTLMLARDQHKCLSKRCICHYPNFAFAFHQNSTWNIWLFRILSPYL